jgi:purine-binding chemotaxis protein CheW
MSNAPQQTTSTRATTRTQEANQEKFLTFCLGSEEYGLPILVVREIIGMIDVTPLPQTPAYVKGVINLRGKIIPVIELRAKFGLTPMGVTQETCIIVVEVASADGTGTFQLGVIVDAVREVLDIGRDNIEPPPSFGSAIPLSFIMGMGKIKEHVVILLDINRIGATGELERIDEAAESGHAFGERSLKAVA